MITVKLRYKSLEFNINILLLNFLICCMIIKLIVKNNVEKLPEENSPTFMKKCF